MSEEEFFIPPLSIGFSESIRQSAHSSSVDFPLGYMRKYWSMKRETLTVRCLSTEARRTNTAKFRNEIRAFLYHIPEDLEDLIAEVIGEFMATRARIMKKIAREQKLTQTEEDDWKLENKLSVQVRAYEKEFFYLKVLDLHLRRGGPDKPIKPQFVLRALAKLSRQRELDEVITTPEVLFSLLLFQECKQPLYKKDVYR